MSESAVRYFESAVRYFTPDSTAMRRKLRSKLEARAAEHAGFLATGTAVDWADYRYRCGQIQALNEAMAICDAAEKEER